MVKSELVNHLCTQQQILPHRDIEKSVNAILDAIAASLSRNNRIEIRGFGSFDLHFRAPRKARNPKTGQAVYTQAKHTPHFKPGKDLRERVNRFKDHYPIIQEKGGEHDA